MMLRLAKTRKEVRVVNDQIDTPTYTPDFARVLAYMCETDKYGVYHVMNEDGYISWAEFAEEIFRVVGKETKVIPVTTEEYGVSPVLANVFLHYILDNWFDVVVWRQCRGEAHLIRYADDFVCCFQYREGAEVFRKRLEERFRKYGLELAEEKTKILEFGWFAGKDKNGDMRKSPESFDFLVYHCINN